MTAFCSDFRDLEELYWKTTGLELIMGYFRGYFGVARPKVRLPLCSRCSPYHRNFPRVRTRRISTHRHRSLRTQVGIFLPNSFHHRHQAFGGPPPLDPESRNRPSCSLPQSPKGLGLAKTCAGLHTNSTSVAFSKRR